MSCDCHGVQGPRGHRADAVATPGAIGITNRPRWRSGANSNIADIPWFSSHSRSAVMSRAAEHGARSFALIWSQNSRVDHEHDAAGGGALGAPPDVEIAAVARGPPMMTRRKQPRCVLQRLRARGRVGGAMYHNARGVHPHACPCARTDAVERKRATVLHSAVPCAWGHGRCRGAREGAQRQHVPTRLVARFKRG